jgi:SAM-dependent methyltransferase
MIGLLKKYWTHPLTKNIDIDSADTISIHREIILSKPLMRAIYRKWYKKFLPSVRATNQIRLPMIEIGSGASHLEKYIPTIIKTDLVAHPNVHQVVDGTKLPYASGSLRCVFVLNALHHFDSPEKFLAEADRVLAAGGRLVITEPSNSPLQKFMIKKFHLHEYFDESVTHWNNEEPVITRGREAARSATASPISWHDSVNEMASPSAHGALDAEKQTRLSRANNALPWIIFQRDRKLFEEKFPRLKILRIKRHTLLFYFASGGLAYRSFLPSFFLPLLHLSEWLLLFVPFLGTEMTIEIEKSPEVRLADSANTKAKRNQKRTAEPRLDA